MGEGKDARGPGSAPLPLPLRARAADGSWLLQKGAPEPGLAPGAQGGAAPLWEEYGPGPGEAGEG